MDGLVLVVFARGMELAASAQVLALQLSDEQYAVPAHPFTTALTTRSLEAAQAGLRGRSTGEGTHKACKSRRMTPHLATAISKVLESHVASNAKRS